MRIVVAISSVFLLLFLAACGGSSTTTPTPPSPTPTVTITASTTSATVAAGGSQQFTATVSGTSNTGVSWSIQEGSAGGTIDATGKYTAPTTPGTYHVVATSMADATKSIVITVTVTAPPSNVTVSISPASVTMFTGSAQQFTPKVSDPSNSGVTWTIQEGSIGGTLAAGYSGLYISSLTPGTYHIVVTSNADPTKSATANVTTIAPPAGSGSFTAQAAPVGSYSGLQAFGDTMLQLGDGSVLTVGGAITRPGGAISDTTWINLAAVLSVDNSGTLTIAQVGNMSTGRSGSTGVLLSDGRALIVDGAFGPGAETVTAEIYDPKTRTFSQTGSLTSNRAVFGLFPQKDSTIFALLGPTNVNGTTGELAGEFYNPATGIFANPFVFSPVAPAGPSTAVLQDGRILLAGGYTGLLIAQSAAEILDPQTHTVSSTGSLTTPRLGATPIALPDGKVLVIGGYQADYWSPLSSAEIYDPATGTFSITGSTLEPLLQPSAILLPSGKVFVVGGNSITAELFDPSTGRFSVAARMPPVSNFFPSFPPRYRMFNMPNGTVMVNSGLSQSFNFYHP